MISPTISLMTFSRISYTDSLQKVSIVIFVSVSLFVVFTAVVCVLVFVFIAILNKPELYNSIPPMPPSEVMRVDSLRDSSNVCASYFRKGSDTAMIQGSWTNSVMYTRSIHACSDWVTSNLLSRKNCAQQDAVYLTAVLIPNSKHSFMMPDIDMKKEFVLSDSCRNK